MPSHCHDSMTLRHVSFHSRLWPVLEIWVQLTFGRLARRLESLAACGAPGGATTWHGRSQ